MIQERYFSSGTETKYKIITVGDPNVGKTTLFWRYLEGDFLAEKPTTVTTIDFKIKQIKIGDSSIKLYIWDTAGQEKYRSIVSTYFKGCDGVMLVFDLSVPSTYKSATTKWHEIAVSKSPNAQIMLIGNKSDLKSVVSDSEAESWCKEHKAKYIKTSVKNNDNVDQCYNILSKSIFDSSTKVKKAESFQIKKKDVKENKSCC